MIESLGAVPAVTQDRVDLETIAAALAETQQAATGEIAAPEAQLQRLDHVIGHALVTLERFDGTPVKRLS